MNKIDTNNCITKQNAFIQSLESEITEFADKANNLADKILSENEPKDDPIVHNHYYYPYYGYNNYSPNYCEKPKISQEDQKKEDTIKLGIAAAVVLGGSVYSLVTSVATLNNAKTNLKDAEKFNEKLKISDLINKDETTQKRISEAHKLVYFNNSIYERQKKTETTSIVLKSVLAGSAAITLAGAIAASPAVMTGGIIAGALSAGGLLLKWGLDNSHHSNFLDALSIKVIVGNLAPLKQD